MTLQIDAPVPAHGLDSPDGGLSAAELAAKYGLSVSGARPGLGEYTRQLWGRRHFINEFA
ncbi:ABC transporter permease, partial [Streptomyces sp. H10-C2]|nr:ABC transporter permease [Streptomyces sp. PH10-H1]MDJ0373248.1 ABC transporter permease [Streptomyces sp. H10-C2]